MYNHFQNLNEDNKSKRLLHFRGSLGPSYDKILLKYELSSGPALSFKVKIKPYNSLSLQIGFFFFTTFLSFPFFSFARWIDKPLQTGFYFYDWAFVWECMKEEWGGWNSTDPWWKQIYFHIDDFFLGKTEMLEDDLCDIENVKFKLGGKDFSMNKITWTRRRQFRRYIPYVLWNRCWESVNMDIKDPPLRSGKGENSYDCGDDGSYGLSCMWSGYKPNWNTRNWCAQQAVEMYVDNVLEDVKRYGGSSSPRGVGKGAQFEYIGPNPPPNSPDQSEAS